MWDLKNGKVSYLKTSLTQYKKTIPSGFTVNFEPNLYLSLLWTLFKLSDDFIFDVTGDIDMVEKDTLSALDIEHISTSKLYINLLEQIVLIKDDKHYHYYETMGKYYEIVKDYKKASNYYNKSLNLLLIDPNRVWEIEIRRLQHHLQRLKTKFT
ncbi:hypothetical protein KKA87_16150 [bacterium]|nr:hypothetical protein [bacterium]MBU1873618.1 hypothetical protein [bacterium]